MFFADFILLEQHLRSFHSLGEDSNQTQIISLIRSKLPKATRVTEIVSTAISRIEVMSSAPFEH